MGNIDDAIRNLRKFAEDEDRRNRRKMEQACLLVLRTAKILCPVDEGHLRAATDMEVVQNSTETRGTIYNPLFYAPYVHQGTGIYSLDGGGRRQPWLWKGDSKKYAGFHWTVGQKPQPFIKAAVEQNLSGIERIFRGE